MSGGRQEGKSASFARLSEVGQAEAEAEMDGDQDETSLVLRCSHNARSSMEHSLQQSLSKSFPSPQKRRGGKKGHTAGFFSYSHILKFLNSRTRAKELGNLVERKRGDNIRFGVFYTPYIGRLLFFTLRKINVQSNARTGFVMYGVSL